MASVTLFANGGQTSWTSGQLSTQDDFHLDPEVGTRHRYLDIDHCPRTYGNVVVSRHPAHLHGSLTCTTVDECSEGFDR